MRICRRLALTAPVLMLGLAATAGCPSREVSSVEPNQAKEQQKEIPVNLNRDIDILWVVDNSSSMGQEQASLAANFQKFADVLLTIEGGLPNIRMGVVSSDVGIGLNADDDDPLDPNCPAFGQDGQLQVEGIIRPDYNSNPPDPQPCPALTDGRRFIEDIAANAEGTARTINYTGTLAEQFSCMAKLGVHGCGFEQHLESMRRALQPGTNEGFLRDNAFLAIIFIQDEDDCSASNRAVFGGTLQDTVESDFGEYSSFRCFEYGTVCDPADDRVEGPRQDCVPDEESDYIEKVSTYVDFVKSVKNDPSKVIVAAITAPATPVVVATDVDKDQLWVKPSCVTCNDGGTDCPGAVGSDPNDGQTLVAARPSIRMNAFLNAFPQRSTFQSICNFDEDTGQVDFSGALTQIALLLKKVVGNPCLEGKLTDTQPSVDGLQPDCRVSDVRDLNLDSEEEFPIPSCLDVSTTPCYNVVQDGTCNTEANVALEIDRGDPPVDPPPNTTVVVRCLVE